MAGPRIRCNPPFGSENELAGAPTKRNSILTISCTPIPASAPAPASVSDLPGRYMVENLQKTTKLALELFVKGHEYGQANSAPRDRALKARTLTFTIGACI